MIQQISPNDDLVLDVVLTDKSGNVIEEALIANLQFVVYTEDTSELQRVYLSKTRYNEGKLHINSSELATLSSGQLYLTTAIALLNSQYNDGSFDYIKTSALPYYLKNSAISVSDDEAILKWKIDVTKSLQNIDATLRNISTRLVNVEAAAGDSSALVEMINSALEGYATIEYVDGQDTSIVNAIPSAVDLTDYATNEDVSIAIRSIPQPDLTPYATTEDVSIALSGKADTSDIPDLEPYALKSAIPSLEGYATTADVSAAISSIPEVDLTGYATVEDVSAAISAIPEVDLTDYATTADVSAAISAIPQPDLTPYATTEDVSTALASKANTADIPSLEGYALLTDIPSLEGYATESYVDASINAIPQPDLTPYATTADVSTALAGKADVADIPSLEGYATDASVAEAIGAIDLTPYATTADVSTALAGKADVADIPSLEGYATDASVAEAIGAIDLTPYATTADVSTALATKANTTDIPSLEGYATDASVAANYTSHTEMENVELTVATAVNRLAERVENIEETLIDDGSEDDGSEDSSTGDSSTGDNSGFVIEGTPYTLSTPQPKSSSMTISGQPKYNGVNLNWNELTTDANSMKVYISGTYSAIDGYSNYSEDGKSSVSILDTTISWSVGVNHNGYKLVIPFTYMGETVNYEVYFETESAY